MQGSDIKNPTTVAGQQIYYITLLQINDAL